MSDQHSYEELIKQIAELQEQNKALQLIESRFRAIYNNSPAAMYETDALGKCISVNRKWCEFAGISPEEAIGDGWQKALHPEDKKQIFDLWAQHSKSGKLWSFEYRFCSPKNIVTWVSGSAKALKDSQGEITGYIGVNIDITERKKTERILLESEQNMASVLNNTQDLVVRIDRNFRHIFANPAVYAANGFSPEQYLGKTNEEIGMPDELCAFWREKHDKVFQSKEPERIEFSFPTVNKGKRDFQAIISPEINDNNEVETIISFMRDITETKKAETTLNDSHERLLTVLDSLEATVYVADMEDYELLFVNKYCKEHFGEVTGSLCWQHMQKDQQGPCPFCTNKYLLDKNGSPSGIHEWEFQNTVTGQWYHIFDRAIRWIDGRIVRLEIATNVTKQKHIEAELEERVRERTLDLQQTNEQLLHAEKMSSIGKLSASIAHEFNNPLQGVTSIVQGIKKRVDLDHDDAELVNLAIKECHRMRDLIKSLQDFNRPTSARKAPMDIHAALESILMLSKKEYATRKISITKKYAEDLPQIVAVSDQLKQVFLNMLNNASDACVHGGNITIETDTFEDNVVIRVHDTGCGISPDDREYIFEPFFTTKAGMKGTGLGLPVSYGIIKAHGGEITVNSEPGIGTLFSVVLPIRGDSDVRK